MINFKRPMLAAPLLSSAVEHTDNNILAAMERLKYPVLATLKMDGIRAIKLNQLVSRRLKLIPNKSIQERAVKLPAGFDMELWNPELSYDTIESIVMSKEHEYSNKIHFHVLDWFSDKLYQSRCEDVRNWFYTKNYTSTDEAIEVPRCCLDSHQLFEFFKICESFHGEGICFRTPNSPYKQGRSTLKEQYLVKLSRYLTSEAIILDYKEQQENGNPTTTNALGYAEHSSHSFALIGKNTLGSLHVKDIKSGIEFDIGTGFTDAVRKQIWNNPDYIGKVITYKHKPIGAKNKPRHPVFKGFRAEIDL